eukprot:m.102764 g.102764  ORF g.102764 m.102764 type:complete len:423 (+) comp14126_c0_seq1:2494-3762(+)
MSSLASEWARPNGDRYDILQTKEERLEHVRATNTKGGFQSAIAAVFLPQGFPESVSRDYIDYQKWDTAQALCSYITGTLATQAVFKGYGVGSSEASAAAATVTWIVRNICSHIGTIAFAYAKGTDFDNNCKQWRLVADVFNDAAILLELISGLFPDAFLFLVCTSSLLRAVVGVAGGATRHAVTHHQTRANNSADVSAKDGSQETVVNLVGMLLGMWLAPAVEASSALLWVLFVAFTILHLYCNYRAVRALQFDELNARRAAIVMQSFLTQKQSIPTPKEVAQIEPIFEFIAPRVPVLLGASLAVFDEPAQLSAAIERATRQGLDYLITVRNERVYVVLHRRADARTLIRARFHAETIRQALLVAPPQPPVAELAALLDRDMASLFAAFEAQAIAAGWHTQHSQLGPDTWRAEWTAATKKME